MGQSSQINFDGAVIYTSLFTTRQNFDQEQDRKGNVWKAVLKAKNSDTSCFPSSLPTYVGAYVVCTAGGTGTYEGRGQRQGHAKDAAAHEYLVENGLIARQPL